MVPARIAVSCRVVISFLTDLGDSESAGVARGVMARIAPQVPVIDLGHDIPQGDIRAGALSLTRAIQYLPEGVLLAAVGLASGVRMLAVETAWGIAVGPDNGLLSPAMAMVGGATRMVSIENPEMRIPSPGVEDPIRDVLAPAAAVLASGQAELDDMGEPVSPASVQPLLLPLPDVGDRAVVGEAWWRNRRGHLQTNIGPDDLELAGLRPGTVGALRVGASLYSIAWLVAGASGAGDDESEAFMYADEFGLMAIGVAGGDPADQLRLAPGTAVTLAGVEREKSDGVKQEGP